MASVTYGKGIMAKVLWQMKLSHVKCQVTFVEFVRNFLSVIKLRLPCLPS